MYQKPIWLDLLFSTTEFNSALPQCAGHIQPGPVVQVLFVVACYDLCMAASLTEISTGRRQ